jgi:hypothetical protein
VFDRSRGTPASTSPAILTACRMESAARQRSLSRGAIVASQRQWRRTRAHRHRTRDVLVCRPARTFSEARPAALISLRPPKRVLSDGATSPRNRSRRRGTGVTCHRSQRRRAASSPIIPRRCCRGSGESENFIPLTHQRTRVGSSTRATAAAPKVFWWCASARRVRRAFISLGLRTSHRAHREHRGRECGSQACFPSSLALLCALGELCGRFFAPRFT